MIIAVSFLFDISARVGGSLELAQFLFRVYAVMAIASLPFLMAYIEFSKSIGFRRRYFIFFALSFILLTLRGLSEFDVFFEDSIISRSGFYFVVYGYDLNSILLVILISWFGIEYMVLRKQQYVKVHSKNVKSSIKLELVLFIISVALLIYTLIGVLLNTIPYRSRPLFINILILLMVLGATYVNSKFPFISYTTI